ncbi:hypothetical protein HDU76_000682 [Blyttiomyces sp. JEL0837]|nr:hypothetical protein HDU76_000682 [Blyttiomyces sp. JEL0837]
MNIKLLIASISACFMVVSAERIGIDNNNAIVYHSLMRPFDNPTHDTHHVQTSTNENDNHLRRRHRRKRSLISETTNNTESISTVNNLSMQQMYPIKYHGGPLMVDSIGVYGIFYGVQNSDTVTRIQRFINSIGPSSWWSVVSTYTDSDQTPVTTDITWKSHVVIDPQSTTYGTILNPQTTHTLLQQTIKSQHWPNSSQNIYIIFLGPTITESFQGGSICVDYCGYHTLLTTSTPHLKYIMIGDPTVCPGSLPPPGSNIGVAGCLQRPYRNHSGDASFSVNRNQQADGMINILAHELSETVTDFEKGWFDQVGYECADKCNGVYGDVSFVGGQGGGNGGVGSGAWNLDLREFGGDLVLVQSQWSAVQGVGCVMGVDRRGLKEEVEVGGDE